MKNLVKHVQNTNARADLWHSGDFVIVGVSGGADSVCLLDVMSKISAKEDLSLAVAHVNYGLREESDGDEAFVRALAEEYTLPLHAVKAPKDLVANENAWREFRYRFFEKVAEELDKDVKKNVKIAVAHNQNDQAETLLLHLLRGSGMQGLSGMSYKRANDQGSIIRPLLDVAREDILEYLSANNLDFREDKTNQDESFVRNKIRKSLLPYLAKEFNNSIVQNLATTSQSIADDYDFLVSEQKTFWLETARGVCFDNEKFKNLSVSEQRHSLRRMIGVVKGDVKNIDFDLIEDIRTMLLRPKNKHKEKSFQGLMIAVKSATVEVTQDPEKAHQ